MTAPVQTVPVRPGGRRGIGGPLVVGGLLVGFLAAGFIKPWDAGQPATRVAAGSAATTAATPTPRTASAGAPVRVNLGLPRLTWDRLDALLRPRDAWGVRAIVARPNRSPADRPIGSDEIQIGRWFVAERWTPFDLAIRDPLQFDRQEKGALTGRLTLDAGDEAIAALGITSPFGDVPLDVRVWRYRAGTLPERLPLREMPGPAPLVERIFLPPPDGSPPRDHWSPGMYVLELLLGWRIARVSVQIPGVAPGTDADVAPRLRPNPMLLGSVRGLGEGPFTLDQRGTVAPVRSVRPGSADEAVEWLGAGPAPNEREPASGAAIAIGLTLGAGAELKSATLRPLAPYAGRFAVTARVQPPGPWSSRANGTARTAAYFSPPVGDAWPAGSYRLDARWTVRSVTRTGSWNLDLPTQAEAAFAPFLAAARAAQLVGGRESALAGPIDAAADPRGRPLRAGSGLRGVTSASGASGGPGASCGSALAVVAGERVLAFGHDHLVVPHLEVSLLSQRAGRIRVPLATATDAVQGLVLFAPLGATWLPGRYELRLRYPEPVYDPDPVERVSFCVAVGTRTGAAARRFGGVVLKGGMVAQ